MLQVESAPLPLPQDGSNSRHLTEPLAYLPVQLIVCTWPVQVHVAKDNTHARLGLPVRQSAQERSQRCRELFVVDDLIADRANTREPHHTADCEPVLSGSRDIAPQPDSAPVDIHAKPGVVGQTKQRPNRRDIDDLGPNFLVRPGGELPASGHS